MLMNLNLAFFWFCDSSGVGEEYSRKVSMLVVRSRSVFLVTIQDCVGVIQGRVDYLTTKKKKKP